MFISLWFGLRPLEVDNLKKDNKGINWKITTQNKIKVLHVLQTKIEGNFENEEDAWKKIPALFEEQLEALELIKKGKFKRPLCKTIQRYFTEKHNTYAGRKGFERIMKDNNISMEFTSRYLGHSNINTTFKIYADTSKADIPNGF